MRVVAALSGGVDSAVAAARAVDAGHDVVGVHLALSADRATHRTGSRGCCTLDDARDARRVADKLGIPFYVWDLAARFREDVIGDFISEYAAGRTPNPCLRCNEKIKFSAVLDRAMQLGFDAVATGHYAQIVDGPAGRELHRAADWSKDQSYVLAVLTREQLAAAMFPLGDTVKDDVRVEAEERGLLVAHKPDSHDICFIPDGDTAAFLKSRLGDKPGDIVDSQTGAVLGQHDGAFAFTVGQRRGLDLKVAAPDGARRYVVGVDVEANQVLVGIGSMLEVRTVHGDTPTYCGRSQHGVLSGTVQLRAHGEPVAAEVILDDSSLTATLATPVRGVAPGQAVVAYEGTRVVASATIGRTA